MKLSKKKSVETYDYVLEEDRKLPKEEQTVFTLKSFNAMDRAAIQDMVHEEELSGMQASVLYAQHAIIGVEDSDIEFETVEGGEHITMALLDRFPQAAVNEIAYTVAKEEGLLESEKK